MPACHLVPTSLTLQHDLTVRGLIRPAPIIDTADFQTLEAE
jgi:hypothetical protein